MTWTINFKSSARKAFNQLDKKVQERILKFLKKIKDSNTPTYLGAPLDGNFASLWRYRIGDYRLICSIHNDICEVIVIHVGHRKDVYR